MRTYVHEDGRRCLFDSHGHRWMHYDHEPPEPRPSERRSYICERIHLPDKIATTLAGDEPAEPDLLAAAGMPDDRGDFGVPGLGARIDASSIIGVTSRGQVVGRILRNGIGPQTELARRIDLVHAPRALAHFFMRNAEYGDDNDFNLGPAGQYVDISRKVQKLKRRWWEHKTAKDGEESDETIVMELIGHLLMALDMLEERDGIKEEAPEG